MKFNLKLIFLYFIILITLVSGGIILAGNVTNNSNPVSNSYSLSDIYNLIHNNATTTEANHNLYPSTDTNTPTMYSVSELYVDLANLINPASTTVTYLGSTPTSSAVLPIPKDFTPTTATGTVTGFTLDDIYNLITENIRPLDPTHTFAPSSEPTTGTMHTLTEIYEKLAGIPDPFILPETVATGTTYLGVSGTYVSIVTVLRQNLVAYYPLDNDTADYSGNGNDGVASGTPSIVPGEVNGGYSFDGVDDLIEIAEDSVFDFSNGDSFSVSAWFKNNGTPNYMIIMNKHRLGDTNGYMFGLTTGGDGCGSGEFFYTASGYGDYACETETADSNWHLITGTYDGITNTSRVYLDGLLKTDTGQVSGGGTLNNAKSLLIGAAQPYPPYYNGYHGFATGIIDEVSIWNKTLTQTDIDYIYNGGDGRSLIQ